MCSICMQNHAFCLAAFGRAGAMDIMCQPVVAIGAIFRPITGSVSCCVASLGHETLLYH